MCTKIRIIIFGLFLALIVNAQTNTMLGFDFVLSNNPNWGPGQCVITAVTAHFPAQRAGLKPLDIIVAVNGKPTNEMSLQALNDNLFGQIGSTVQLTVKKIGQKEVQKMNLKNQEPLPDNSFSEARLRNNLITINERSKKTTNQAANSYANSTMRDPEAQFENYNTFDFEFTNQTEPLLEKKLASTLESCIVQRGLKRDRENPDLLVFINFFSGNEKQYIPPTQKISTRYQFGYDIWSGWGNKQYVESQQVGGYTQVNYFATMKLAFMDAQKAKQQVKTPPIVWQSEMNGSFMSAVDLQAIAYNVYSGMLEHFPVSDFNTNATEKETASVNGSIKGDGNYFYTGICYDVKQPNLVVYVYPESPAAKAGIAVGDKIISVNTRKIPTTLAEMENSYLYEIRKAREAGKPVSVLDNGIIKSGFSYILGDYENVQQKIPFRFETDRAGRMQTILINPEVWCYQSNLPDLYKVKLTSYQELQDRLFAIGVGKEIPKNPLFFPSGINPVNGYCLYISIDGITSKNWRMINDYAFTWFKTGIYNGNESNLLEAKWTIGPGVQIFPSFYLTASVGFGGYFFLVKQNDAANISLFKVYFMPGVHWTIARRFYLFGRYNMSSGTSQSIDFGIKIGM